MTLAVALTHPDAPKYRKGTKVAFQTIGRGGVAHPREGCVVEVIHGKRGFWVVIKDKVDTLFRARACNVHAI